MRCVRHIHFTMRLFDGPQGPFSIPAPPCKGDVREEHLPLLNGAHKGFLHREEARRRTYLAQFGARLFAAPFLLLVLALCSASVAEETATGAEHEGAQPFETFIIEASQRFSIPVSWIVEVMAVESTGDVRARSPKGAMGLMQLMPDTWAELRRRHALGSDPFDPVTTSWQERRICVKCSTASDRTAYLLPITQDRCAIRSILPGVHCLSKPKPM